MILKTAFNKLFPRRHDFDLEHPETVVTTTPSMISGLPYAYHRFHCRRCGATLALDLWQMKNLPRSMQYGCKGRDK